MQMPNSGEKWRNRVRLLSFEDALGQAIRVQTDFYGHKRSVLLVGPLADLKPGQNVLNWSGARRSKKE